MAPVVLLLALRWSMPWGLAVLLMAVCLPPAWAQGGGVPRESAVKAAFLFKFPSFVEWPAGRFQGLDEPLAIGVLGNDEVAADLEQLVAGRSIEGRPVAVRRLAEGQSAGNLHVLFVGATTPARLRDVASAAPGPVLLVAEQDDALRQGASINFVRDGGRVRFGAAPAAAEARGLRLSARLLAVAAQVEGRGR